MIMSSDSDYKVTEFYYLRVDQRVVFVYFFHEKVRPTI